MHYLGCPVLWSITAEATCNPIAPDILGRLCVGPATDGSVLALIVAYTTYHDIKMGHLTLIERAHCSGDFGLLLAHATVWLHRLRRHLRLLAARSSVELKAATRGISASRNAQVSLQAATIRAAHR